MSANAIVLCVCYTYTECKAMKYRRFWIDRKKAVNFYGELTLVFLQVYSSHFSVSVTLFYCTTARISTLIFTKRVCPLVSYLLNFDPIGSPVSHSGSPVLL